MTKKPAKKAAKKQQEPGSVRSYVGKDATIRFGDSPPIKVTEWEEIAEPLVSYPRRSKLVEAFQTIREAFDGLPPGMKVTVDF